MTEQRRVLIVGDDAATTRLVASAGAEDWRAELVPDAEAALERVVAGAADLVVFGLPDDSFVDLKTLRRFRAASPDLRIVIITANQSPAEVVAAFREHAFGRFSAPVSAEGLNELIARALDEAPWDDGIEVLSARPGWVTLRLKCRRQTAEHVVRFMTEWETRLPAKEAQDVGTALREMVLNAMEHGGRMDPEQTVDVSSIRTERVLLYEIRDHGEGFVMDELPHAAVSNPTDSPAAHVLYRSEQEMRAGGFGILITRGLVDEMIYNEKGNEVVLIKYLDSNQ